MKTCLAVFLQLPLNELNAFLMYTETHRNNQFEAIELGER